MGAIGTRSSAHVTGSTTVAGQDKMPAFTQPEEQKLARIAYSVIQQFENQPQAVPTIEHLKQPEIQAAIVKAVEERRAPAQGELDGVTKQPDIAAVVAKMVDLVVRQTIAPSRAFSSCRKARCNPASNPSRSNWAR